METAKERVSKLARRLGGKPYLLWEDQYWVLLLTETEAEDVVARLEPRDS